MVEPLVNGDALMGYREDVAVAISEAGWADFVDEKDSSGQDMIDDIDSLLAGADEHWENPDGDHMFIFSSIKTSADDFSAFNSILMQVPHQQWKMVSVGEDGAEDITGDWDGNPFDIGVQHQLSYNSGGCILNQVAVQKPAPADTSVRYWPNVVPTATAAPVNNHTCTQCGNNACSKSEKSCWKCGTAITA